MISYGQIKSWYQDKENKQKLVYGLCFILVFIIGFGTGRASGTIIKPPVVKQTNYTTKPATSQTANKAEQGTVKGAATSSAVCLVKGNAASKIYHVPGGSFYTTLKSPQCFTSEADAQAAGYRKSSR